MKFSIIIPTRNRAETLKKSLEKIRNIDYPRKDFEVIVVNNGSTDNTQKVLSQIKLDLKGVNFSVFYERRLGRSWAFKKGMLKARFSKIISIDDDISITADFLKTYKACFEQYQEAAVIGGKIEVVGFGPRTNYMKKLLIYFPWIFGEVDLGQKTHKLIYPESLFAGNMALNRDVIGNMSFSTLLGRKFGNGYLYGEDFELNLRLLQQQKAVMYCPNILVENNVEVVRLTLPYLTKRVFYSGIERYIINFLQKDYRHGGAPTEKIEFELKNLFYLIANELLLLRVFLRVVRNLGYAVAPIFLKLHQPYEVIEQKI